MTSEEEPFSKYIADVRKERRSAHGSSVRWLGAYRVLRLAGVLAAAVTPVLAALGEPKWWTVGVAAFSAVAVGIAQLTRIEELSVLDRDRADRLQRELRYLDNGWGGYRHQKTLSDTFIENVEAIRRDWERQRVKLIRRTFASETDGEASKREAEGEPVAEASRANST